MKKIISVALLLCMVLMLTACGTSVEKEIEGVWHVTVTDQISAVYVFEDGRVTCTTTAMGVTLDPNSGDYTIADGEIQLHYDNGVEASLDYTFVDNNLRIFMSGEIELIKE